MEFRTPCFFFLCGAGPGLGESPVFNENYVENQVFSRATGLTKHRYHLQQLCCVCTLTKTLVWRWGESTVNVYSPTNAPQCGGPAVD